jgi:hypothetical protein
VLRATFPPGICFRVTKKPKPSPWRGTTTDNICQLQVGSLQGPASPASEGTLVSGLAGVGLLLSEVIIHVYTSHLCKRMRTCMHTNVARSRCKEHLRSLQRSAQALRALPPPDCVETIQGSVAYGNARHGVTASHVTA